MNGTSRLRGIAALTVVVATICTGCSGSADSASTESPSAPENSASPTVRSVSLVDLTPAKARNMTSSEARRWLRKWTRQTDSNELRDAEGQWVPQVSSKCTGLDVDIKGGKPDGTTDTYSVTNPEILAFHLSLRDQFSAVNTEWSSLSDRATTGPCAGKDVWIALIPQTYPNPGRALDVCDEEGFPYGECAARFIPSDSSEATEMVLPGDSGDDRTSEGSDVAKTPKPRKPKTTEPDTPSDDSAPAVEEPVYLTAPSVVGLERREAEANLRAIGFRPHTSADMEMGAVSTDMIGDCYITQQFYRPGSQVKVSIGPGGNALPPMFPMNCAP